MFRIVEDAFKEKQELNELASFVLTEVIKAHLEPFFDEGWDEASVEEWIDFVREDEVLWLVPMELETELEEAGLDAGIFFAKKIAQMMEDLNKPEQVTFDLLGEYLLAKLIQYYNHIQEELIPLTVKEVLPQLKKLLFEYYRELEVSDQEEEEEYRVGYNAVTDTQKALKQLLQFKNFLLTEEEDFNFVFWDVDYEFIDEWGLGSVLKECQEGCLVQRGYGGNYVHQMLNELI